MVDIDVSNVENEMQIRDLLEILSELHAQRAALADPFSDKIAVLQEEMAQATAEVDEQIASLEQAVRRAVASHGHSVEADQMRAIYVKPRVRWDAKRLDGYAEAHPEIKAFRQVGKPSVRLVLLD